MRKTHNKVKSGLLEGQIHEKIEFKGKSGLFVKQTFCARHFLPVLVPAKAWGVGGVPGLNFIKELIPLHSIHPKENI